MTDAVNHPSHYTSHESGIECIQITEHMNFCLGNATKYIWRAGLKSDNPIEDLRKASWYIKREIARLETQTIEYASQKETAPFRTSQEVRERSSTSHLCTESTGDKRDTKDEPHPTRITRPFES